MSKICIYIQTNNYQSFSVHFWNSCLISLQKIYTFVVLRDICGSSWLNVFILFYKAATCSISPVEPWLFNSTLLSNYSTQLITFLIAINYKLTFKWDITQTELPVRAICLHKLANLGRGLFWGNSPLRTTLGSMCVMLLTWLQYGDQTLNHKLRHN